MFQSLMSLDDDEIDNIMMAVRTWCDQQGVSIESAEGRNALHVALNAVWTSRPAGDVVSTICTELSEHMLVH